jgi:hypothetical protein
MEEQRKRFAKRHVSPGELVGNTGPPQQEEEWIVVPSKE